MNNHPTLTLALSLIARPSITPNDAGCQTLISEQLTPLGFHCENMPFNEVQNLWARYGNQSPLICFAGHTDVVPAGPLDLWSAPPFTPTIRDDYLYGRGAADMKGALAAMVIAAKNFITQNPAFPGSIAFLMTSDEEGPSLDGTRKVIEVLKKRGEKIDYCIIGEPVSEKTLADQMIIGRRGSLHGKLTIYGKQGHIARPNLAINPIHISIPFLQAFTQTVWDQGNADFPPTTCQISNVYSGVGALNVIPPELTIDFNFRFSNVVTPTILQARTENMLKQYGIPYTLRWEIGAEPFLTQQKHLIQLASKAIQAYLHKTPQLATNGGTSDGRFIANNTTEVMEIGACCHTAHHIDEKILIKDLIDLTIIYENILKQLFN